MSFFIIYYIKDRRVFIYLFRVTLSVIQREKIAVPRIVDTALNI